MKEEEIELKISSVKYWWHRIELTKGVFTPGEDDPMSRLSQIGIPDDLSGKTVLDIGAYDGFFSFLCEERGAEVTALDVISPDECGFNVAKEIKESKVKHIKSTIYDLDPKTHGTFDVILFLGVIYHLRHPLYALDKIHEICNDLMILESQICDRYFINSGKKIVDLESVSSELLEIPILQFYPSDELNNDPSNWFSPNEKALKQMIMTSGFNATKYFCNGVRATFHCTKAQRLTQDLIDNF